MAPLLNMALPPSSVSRNRQISNCLTEGRKSTRGKDGGQDILPVLAAKGKGRLEPILMKNHEPWVLVQILYLGPQLCLAVRLAPMSVCSSVGGLTSLTANSNVSHFVLICLSYYCSSALPFAYLQKVGRKIYSAQT
jgi:hypothetical protein